MDATLDAELAGRPQQAEALVAEATHKTAVLESHTRDLRANSLANGKPVEGGAQ